MIDRYRYGFRSKFASQPHRSFGLSYCAVHGASALYYGIRPTGDLGVNLAEEKCMKDHVRACMYVYIQEVVTSSIFLDLMILQQRD